MTLFDLGKRKESPCDETVLGCFGGNRVVRYQCFKRNETSRIVLENLSFEVWVQISLVND